MNQWRFTDRLHRAAATRRRNLATVFSTMAALATVLTLAAPAVHAVGAVRKQADFNGDGYADIAIGAPREDYKYNMPGGQTLMRDAGFVHITYGSAQGLKTTVPGQTLKRSYEPNNSPFRPDNYAEFGEIKAWGDFNRDGYDDLAVSARTPVPCVDIHFGSRTGLNNIADQRITPDKIRGAPAGGGFGMALATGDTNGDGYIDLAISQYIGGRGAVYIVKGSGFGLQTSSAQMLSYSNYAPSSMVMGDFNKDGLFDLAMGIPAESYGELYSVGRVVVAYGTLYGMGSPQVWHQDVDGIAGICEEEDQFGWSVEAADFNNDGAWDLVVGVPRENNSEGVVHLIFGIPGIGLTSYASQLYSMSTGNGPTPEEGDWFGDSVAAIHLEPDDYPELAIGVTGYDDSSGIVRILTVIPGKLGVRHAWWGQESYGIIGEAENPDGFGMSLAVGDFDGSGFADLAIGVSGEDDGAGAVNVIYGTGNGLSHLGNQVLWQGFEGTSDTQEELDGFGFL